MKEAYERAGVFTLRPFFVLAFSPQEHAARIAHAMHAAFEARGVSAKAWALDVDLTGARVEPPGEVPAPSLEPVL